MNNKILIIDDDKLIRETVEYLLNKGGFQSDCATGGMQARELLAKNDYAVALVDLCMPKVDGFEVLRGSFKESAEGF